MTRSPLLAVCFCFGLCIPSVGAQTRKPPMAEIIFSAVPCRLQDCQDRDHQGNIQIVYSDGTTQTPTTAADAVGQKSKGEDAKLSPDHRTAGWLQGEHVTASDGTYFAGTDLVLYRNGHIVTTIHGDKYFVEAWEFWNGGKQIVLRSRAEHGEGMVELHDARTGRQIAEVIEWQVNAHSPLWARTLSGLNR